MFTRESVQTERDLPENYSGSRKMPETTEIYPRVGNPVTPKRAHGGKANVVKNHD